MKQHRKYSTPLLKAAGLFGVFSAVYAVNKMDLSGTVVEQYVQNFGYIGLFVASVISGFNVIVPVPVVAFFPFFVSTGLQEIPIILVISFGMVVGDLLGYSIGRGGREMFSEKKQKQLDRMTVRIDRMQQRHRLFPAIFLFFYAAFLPIPNELVVIPMGFFRFRLRYMVIAIFLGNLVFNILLALGFTHLPNVL